MTDVFLSYKKEDVDIVRPFAAALESQGLTVWWDRKIAPGEQWADVIEEAIENAGAVVVVWTHRSVESKWVNKEARKGEARGNLIPALLEDAEVPFEFEHIQAANLIGWDYATDDVNFAALVREISSVLGGRKSRGVRIPDDLPPPTSPTSPSPRATGRRRPNFALLTAVSLFPLLALLAYSFLPVPMQPIRLSDVVSTHVEMTVAASAPAAGVLATGTIPVSAVLVSEASRVFIPATDNRDGIDVEADLLDLVALDGTVDMSGIRFADGGVLGLGPGEVAGEIRITLSGVEGDVTFSVSETVEAFVGDGGPGALDFGPAGTISVTPRDGALAMDVTLADSIRGVTCGACEALLLVEDLDVADVKFRRVEHDPGFAATALRSVSTISSGSLQVGTRSPILLERGDELRFGAFNGSIRSVTLSDAPYTVNALAQTTVDATHDGTRLQPVRFGSMRLIFQVALLVMILMEIGVLWVLKRRA